jgi:hypothetical protein
VIRNSVIRNFVIRKFVPVPTEPISIAGVDGYLCEPPGPLCARPRALGQPPCIWRWQQRRPRMKERKTISTKDKIYV